VTRHLLRPTRLAILVAVAAATTVGGLTGCGTAERMLSPTAAPAPAAGGAPAGSTTGGPDRAGVPATGGTASGYDAGQAPGAGPVAPPGTGGGTTPAQVAAANGMTPDNVAGYCRQTADLALWGTPDEIGSPANFRHAVEIIVPLKPHTPASLMPDVVLLQNDYQAVADQRRVYVQVKDEVNPAYSRVMSFRHTLCDVN
jgi:hypothetical protein